MLNSDRITPTQFHPTIIDRKSHIQFIRQLQQFRVMLVKEREICGTFFKSLTAVSSWESTTCLFLTGRVTLPWDKTYTYLCLKDVSAGSRRVLRDLFPLLSHLSTQAIRCYITLEIFLNTHHLPDWYYIDIVTVKTVCLVVPSLSTPGCDRFNHHGW